MRNDLQIKSIIFVCEIKLLAYILFNIILSVYDYGPFYIGCHLFFKCDMKLN